MVATKEATPVQAPPQQPQLQPRPPERGGPAPGPEGGLDPIHSFLRSAEFWGRASVIYGSYKAAQLRALALRLQGRRRDEIKARVWDGQHEWAGEQMFKLCIDLRGFYLKAGQFIGARADFVPEQVCRQLCVLQDRVPPMNPALTEQVLKHELGVEDLGELFEWIDLDSPLGSASISQVHKAQLRSFSHEQLRRYGRARRGRARRVVLAPGDTAWLVCNDAGLSLAELQEANKGVDLESLKPGDVVRVPEVLALHEFQDHNLGDRILGSEDAAGGGRGGSSSSSSDDDGSASDGAGWLETSSSWGASEPGGDRARRGAAVGDGDALVSGIAGGGLLGLGRLLASLRRGGGARGGRGGGRGGGKPAAERPVTTAAGAAVAHAVAVGSVPKSGLVAVKVQYPDALQVMSEDLINLRAISAFLSKTELKFDLVSAVDELQKQIHLEFDFMREARVMDSIAAHLAPISSRVAVPRSVPGLVTRRVMAMTFMEGTPLMQLQDKVAHLPKWQRDKAARIILSNLSEAYGRMILGEGLFQADGHPGNILVRQKGSIALLDYGQSKQLPAQERDGLARLMLALHREDTAEISAAVQGLGIVISKDDPALRAKMAYGMFDTRGTVDPFDPNSPIKKAAIEYFPPDIFFVLRVVQLLRGIAQGMGVSDFSCASQWAPLARDAIRAADKRQRRAAGRRRRVPSLAAIMSPLRLSA